MRTRLSLILSWYGLSMKTIMFCEDLVHVSRVARFIGASCQRGKAVELNWLGRSRLFEVFSDKQGS
jgi:hypothetical protein